MLSLFLRAAALVVIGLLVVTPTAHAASDIVISQVYGGGGNAGAQYTHDFVELFNRSNAPVSIAGWSIQYASATGTGNFGSTATQITELPSVVINAGQYYLVQQAAGAGNGAPLPTADHIDELTPIAMAAGAGKVALVSDATSLGCNGGSAPCDASQMARIVDLVGYGNANFYEGSAAAPTLTNTTAGFRAAAGCTDTDDNAADFSAAAPAPRNTSSTLNVCGGPPPPLSLSIDDVTIAEGDSGTTSFVFTVSLSAPAPEGGVSFSIATEDDTATVADNDYVSANLVGETITEGQQTYEFEVLVNGDTNIEPTETFLVNVTNVFGAVVAKGEGVGTIINDDFAPPVFDVVISQVYGGGGNGGAIYTHDFVELFNNGSSAVNVTGWSVQYTSATGTGTWSKTDLNGSIEPGQYYLVQQAAGAGGTTPLPTPDATGTSAMAAGAGKVALVANTTSLSGGCPAGAHIIDLVGYGSTATCFEGLGPTAAPSNTNAVHRKRGGCFDSNDNAFDFTTGLANPRNSASPFRLCEYTPYPINQIQGSGLVTPFLDQDVSTTGIVTAKKSNGFFLQTPDNAIDADPATSEGIFVFTSTLPAVSPGDFVTVNGTATEFHDMTQISSTLPGEVTIHSNGSPLPEPIVLTTSILDPNGSATQLERFEGMRMHADTLVSVAPTNQFGETQTTLPGVPRPMREPGIDVNLPIPPDPVSGLIDCCIPIWDRNPERIMIDADGLAGAPFVNVTSHVTLSGVTGPLDFSFNDYKILPETPPATSPNMSAQAIPVPASGVVTIAGFNIENFTGGETQRRKAALAIRNVLHSPDILGHVEIGSLAALEALAAQVNDDAVAAEEPNPGYEARLIPFGTFSQHLGFLVKTSRVQIDSVTQVGADEQFINPNTNQLELLHDRPPLVLRATVDPGAPSRRPVIVVLIHNRSFINADAVGGEGPRVRAKRTAQAESVASLLQSLQFDNPNTPVMALGDYNAYQFNDGYTDPVSVMKGTPTPGDQVVVAESPDLVDPDFINLTDGLPVEEAYSFIFEGTPQALDHVLVSNVAHGYVKGYSIGRANADFPSVPSSLFAADPTRPERSSDHDMPVAYFKFPSISGLAVDKPVLSPPNHKMIDVNVSYTPVDRCGAVTKTLSVSSNEPVNADDGDGDTDPDWEIVDAHNVRLRAERSAFGDGRVYTITVTVADGCGLITEDPITVHVPKSNPN